MFRRRCITAAAIVSSGLFAAIAFAPAAHATEFPSEPTAQASLQCDPGADQFKPPVANWHIHIANAPSALDNAHFQVTVDAQPMQPYTLLPGDTQDLVISAPDGLPTHALIVADGDTLYDNTTVSHCNAPFADIFYSCGQNNQFPFARYAMGNNSDKPVAFEIHESNGTVIKETHYSMHGITVSYGENFKEGQHYHGWISEDGVVVKAIDGVVHCAQSTPPTTTPKQPSTTTSTVVAHSSGPSDPPTTAAATESLPFTGGSSVPLSLIGAASLLGGAVAVALARRRIA